MTDRTDACAGFVAASGYAAAQVAPVSGDASNRRYDRLTLDGANVILMDAPPDKGEDVRPFIRIAQHLRHVGLSAPSILNADKESGFLILEDLGDDLFARVMDAPDSDEATEKRLYSGAIDVLVALHDVPLPDPIAGYDAALMTDLAALAFDWYLAATSGSDDTARAQFAAAMRSILDTVDTAPHVLILRDYHAENLLWLPDRDGNARVGLLDFQDAMAGHPAYDLVSLLQDARRDVTPALEPRMIARYCDATGCDPTPFDAAYHILGAQRNLRIIGIFALLCVKNGKVHYPDMIPRVWAHLMRDLAHPALAPVADMIIRTLPAPTPDTIQKIKDQCGTFQTA